mmetsp:Transcript_41284/g.84445  ORF Transcript_41284/g.84445 Transcript_41284/m.84445 type:complete len:93 (-) Transcript_41284:148-426(-)
MSTIKSPADRFFVFSGGSSCIDSTPSFLLAAIKASNHPPSKIFVLPREQAVFAFPNDGTVVDVCGQKFLIVTLGTKQFGPGFTPNAIAASEE